MSALLRFRVGASAAALSCLLLGYAAAQQIQSGQARPDQPRVGASGQTDTTATPPSYRQSAERRTANYRGANVAAGGQNQAVDHYLAACLLGQNEAEVQLSEIAQQKSENAEVKQFAQQMIEDHKKMIEQLQPLAGMQSGAARGISGSRTETERSTTTDTSALPGSSGAQRTTGTTDAAPAIDATNAASTDVATNERTAAGGGAIHQLGQIEKQIGDRCLQSAKEELQQKSGAEFDKCYVGMAVGAHMHALAALEVIGQQTQGQLAQVAKQAQPTVQEHMTKAKQLMKQLDSQAGANGSTAERKTTTRTE